MRKNLYALKDHHKECSLYLRRLLFCSFVVGSLIIALIIRLVFLQIFQYDVYKTLSLNNQVRVVPIPPTRGLIYDRNGVLLAENVPAFSLEITPERTPNLEETLKIINDITPITENEKRRFYKKLKYKRRNTGIPIRVKLTEEEVAKFSVEKFRLPGINIVAQLIRYYPYAELFSHVLGYIGPISEKELNEIDHTNYYSSYYVGKIGIEKFYESTLQGKAGYQHIETDAKGRTIRILKRIPPISGSNLYLSLDSRLQKASIEALQGLKGAVIAIDPKTGEILTMISAPAFDPNLFTQGIDSVTYHDLQNSPDKPLFNRAIRGQYPPGSTLKPIVALQGLELGIIQPDHRTYCPGWYQLNGTGRLWRDWIYFSKHHGHGTVDFEKAMAHSCDTYFFTLAPKLGIKHLHNIYTRFGLGARTHVDTTGEATGLAPSIEWKKKTYNEDWFPGDTLNAIIGQGRVLATPLQIAQMTAIIANRGKRWEPRFVQSIYDPHTNKLIEKSSKEGPPVVLQQEKNWEIVINAMQKVVHMPGGTAYRISRGLQYQIAGKTGTAQVFNLRHDEGYDANRIKAHLRDHSWFIAFAPADDPQIALAVLVENKHTKAAADISRVILDSFFNLKSATETSDMTGEDETEVGGEENME